MALRMTSRGMLTIDYDVESEKWRSTLRPPSLRDLGRVVELEPGLSLSLLFDVVAQSPELMEVVGEMCFVDVATLHARSRLDGEELKRSDFVKVVSLPDTAVNELVLERTLSLPASLLGDLPAAAEPSEEEARYHPPGKWLVYGLGVCGSQWPSPLTLGSTFQCRMPVPESLQDLGPFVDWLAIDAVYASVVHLPLRLRTEGEVYSEEHERRAELPFPWRFYEVLLAAYGPFGEPPHYLDMGQADLVRDQEHTEVLRQIFEAPDWQEPEGEQEGEE